MINLTACRVATAAPTPYSEPTRLIPLMPPADAPKIDPKDYPDETKVPPREGAIPKPKGRKKPRQPKIDYSKPLEYGIGPGKALIHYAPLRKNKGSMKTEQTSVTGDGSKLSPKHLPGGPNSQFNIDGTPKTPKKKKPATGPKGGDSQRTKDLLPKPEKTTPAPKTRKTKYNPYGPGTVNPSNMSSTTGP